MSRSLLAFEYRDETDIHMYNAHSLFMIKGRRIQLPDLLLASRLQLLDPVLALPYRRGVYRFLRRLPKQKWQRNM